MVTPSPSINFTVFGGPMYTYNQLKNVEKILQLVEEEQKSMKVRNSYMQ